MKKIYITGSVGSGKSTLAKKLSKKLDIPYYELDRVMHKKISETRLGNEKRNEKERDEIFNTIISSTERIIEDGLRECFKNGLAEADTIILLDIPYSLIQFRIIIRWVKQNLKIEKCEYIPSIYMLKFMFKWSKWYKDNKNFFVQNFNQHKSKLVIWDKKKVKAYLKSA